MQINSTNQLVKKDIAKLKTENNLSVCSVAHQLVRHLSRDNLVIKPDSRHSSLCSDYVTRENLNMIRPIRTGVRG